MAQITEDYVSFETAKLLREKGFDEPIEMLIREDGTRYHADTNSVSRKRHIMLRNSEINMYSTDISCPTLQMAMKWLREVHNLCLFVIPATIDNILRPGYAIYPICDNKWEWCASKNDGSKATFGCDINKDYCDSYENACEAAIKYCLENFVQCSK